MGIIPLLLILPVVAIPAWVLSSGGSREPAVEWPVWEKTMSRLIRASGGFTCPSEDVIKDIRALCQKSLDERSSRETVRFEQRSGETLLSCEARKDSLLVRFALDPGVHEESPCSPRDPQTALAREPEFVFTRKGKVNSISFTAASGERQTVSIRSCRRKLKGARDADAQTLAEFERRLARSNDDPQELSTANRLCLVYDAAPGWRRWREKFLVVK